MPTEPDTAPPAQADRPTALSWALVVLVVAIGVLLRGYDLASIPLWVDEAESAINGLTIQDEGVPTDSYLGLPIYENTLTQPWPDHPEYEFADSSYSDVGVAVYHGWLPLYSIAASQIALGVEPDRDANARSVQHDPEAVDRRVIAARLPSVIYGGLFLVLLFTAATVMYGRDAGWAALLFGGLAEPFVIAGRQARYYSATLALSVGCCLLTWQVFTKGRARDFVLAGVGFGLLFHTHVLSFAVLCLGFGVVLPSVLRRRGGIAGVVTMGLIVLAMTLPWMIFTGFLRQAVDIPPARTMLEFPRDLLAYPLERKEFLVIATLSLAWVAAVTLLPGRLPNRLVEPIRGRRMAFVYLFAWGVFGLLTFTLLVPAASYFLKRLILAVMGPGVLLTALFAAAVARAMLPRHSTLLASIGVLGLMLAQGFLPTQWPWRVKGETSQQQLFAFLREQEFADDAKLYATPNEHLTMQYALGLPVQSIAPIRKSFLDHYQGEVVVIDPVAPFAPYGPEGIRGVARENGVSMTEAEADRWAEQLSNALVRRDAAERYGAVVPPPPELPPHVAVVLDKQRELTARLLREDWSLTRENAAVFRGQPVVDWSAWWPIFFYRFVDWESRVGDGLNYGARARSGTAYVLDSGFVVLRSPPPAPTPAAAPSGGDVDG